jgi:methionyl-tRNA formyltransferase
MNIVFMGTPEFAVPTLRLLIEHPYDIRAVITQPDRAKGRGRNVVAPPVKTLAEQHGILVLQPEKIRAKEVQARLKEIAPDLIVVVAYGQIIPEAILQIPRLGCINVHGSLLPKYRGAAPIHWAIIQGEKETGITTMFMDKGMDTGDMLLKKTIPIENDDTAGTLHDKLRLIGAELLLETLRKLEAGTLTSVPQDHDGATYAPMLKKEDGLIHWKETAVIIERKIRGFFPWPGAYTYFQGTMIKLLQVAIEEETAKTQGTPPGTVLELDNDQGPLIATGHGDIRIIRIQPQNKKPMRCSDFCRGYRLAVDDILGK